MLDGACDCIRDWDFALEFEDASLMTHITLFKLASPVVASVLTVYLQAKAPCLEETSLEAWIVILNHIHLSAPPPFVEFRRYPERMAWWYEDMRFAKREREWTCAQADVFEQAEKFKMDFLLVAIDEAILSRLPSEAHINNALCFSHLEDQHIPLYRLAVRYKSALPQTINGILAHLVKILQFCSSQSPADFERNRENGCLPKKQAMMNAIKDGSVDFYKRLTENLLEKFFFL